MSVTFGLSLAGNPDSYFNAASYKQMPQSKALSALNFTYYTSYNHVPKYCENCFPVDFNRSSAGSSRFVDLLEFSQFGGIPYPLCDNVKPPSRILADLRYTWSTALPHDYPTVTKEVLTSDRVKNAIEKVHESGSLPKSAIAKRARGFFAEIHATLSRFVCKVCAYVLYKVFRRLMSKLLVCTNELETVRSAEQTGIPLVYLPLHKSHMDYLLLTWCTWHFGLQLPHIASGDNLNLSGFGWLLRSTGAFFIRRRVNPSDEGGKDALYRSLFRRTRLPYWAVLHSYIEQLLKKRLPIEFFLEGTRSRFGKALVPKNGLISNVVEAVQQGTIKDCYLVPVSYTYDAVFEGIFLRELQGLPRERESFMAILRGVFRGFSSPGSCGVVRMHYGKPFLLSDYLRTLTNKKPKQLALTRLPQSFSYRELVPWHHEHSAQIDNRSLIRAIGFHVVYDAQMIMSTSMVSVISALLLGKFRQGIDLGVLASDARWLCEAILAEGGEVLGFVTNATSGKEIVKYALPFISSCVEYVDENTIKPRSEHRELLHLAYNRNALVFRFAAKSALAMSLASRPSLKSAQPADLVIEDTLSICDWMQFEVLFCRPCDDLRSRIHELLGKGGWCNVNSGPLVAETDDDCDWEAGDGFQHNVKSVQYRDERAREMIIFHSNFIRPFLQSLYILVWHLTTHDDAVQEHGSSESKYIKNLCKTALDNRSGLPFEPFLESINSDSFKNGLRILRYKGFLSPNDTKVERVMDRNLDEVISNLERVLRIY